MEVRKPLHAGSWYPRYKPDLIRNLKEYFDDNEFGPGEEPKTLNNDTRTIIGGVSPHAGYIYSGNCAAHTYLNIFREKIPDTILILGNDHNRYDKIAIMKEGEWETPLGNLKVDTDLAEKILENTNTIILDNSAFIGYPHQNEHNIEIQLPFIKYCVKDQDVQIVPIKIGLKYSENYEIYEKISTDIANAIKSMDKDIVIVASSDMTHRGLK
ncbi:MAG: AmmeMemoRadiSam system protein B, partial [Promethearchaeota archaeon]